MLFLFLLVSWVCSFVPYTLHIPKWLCAASCTCPHSTLPLECQNFLYLRTCLTIVYEAGSAFNGCMIRTAGVCKFRNLHVPAVGTALTPHKGRSSRGSRCTLDHYVLLDHPYSCKCTMFVRCLIFQNHILLELGMAQCTTRLILYHLGLCLPPNEWVLVLHPQSPKSSSL